MDAPRIFTPEYYTRLRKMECDSWWNAGMRDVAALILELAELPKSGVMLDIGCGSGQTMAWFAGFAPGWRIIGLDIASEPLMAAKDANLSVMRATGLDLPVRSASVDLVIVLDVLQHLPLNGGDQQALREIARVLRPGGHVFLRTNAQSFPHVADDPFFQFHKYDVAELRERLEESGLKVVRLGRVNALLGLAEIPRELKVRDQRHSYHGVLSQAATDPPWRSALKRSWLGIEGRALRYGMRWPIGRTIVGLCRKGDSMTRVPRRLAVMCLAASLLCGCPPAATTKDRVLVERTPDRGLQPRALADGRGTVHIVYFKGEPASGNLYYVRRLTDGTYSKAIRVNSEPNTAIAIGSVRGAQLAIGRGGRIHIVWNGSAPAPSSTSSGLPLLYTRLDPATDRFEAQRNLVTWAPGLDGGGAVTADDRGQVVVAWHGIPKDRSDADGAVYVRRSLTDGADFSREERVGAAGLGACGCCSMQALLEPQRLYIVYRAAGENVHRDTMLLTSRNGNADFETRRLDEWKLEACPLSTAALAGGPHGVWAAWETEGQIKLAALSPEFARPIVQKPESAGRQKHPVLASNNAGEWLLAWLEGSGWGKGGTVAWQIYGAGGHPSAERGLAGEVPAWGLVAVAALADGRFLLLH